MFYSGGNGSSGEASCLSHKKDIRYLAVGSAWFVSAEELVGSDQGRFSEKWHKKYSKSSNEYLLYKIC